MAIISSFLKWLAVFEWKIVKNSSWKWKFSLVKKYNVAPWILVAIITLPQKMGNCEVVQAKIHVQHHFSNTLINSLSYSEGENFISEMSFCNLKMHATEDWLPDYEFKVCRLPCHGIIIWLWNTTLKYLV